MKYGLNFWKMQWSLGQWACKTCLLGAKRALCVVPENALIQLIRPVAASSSISRARAESHTSEKLKSCNCFWHQSHLRFRYSTFWSAFYKDCKRTNCLRCSKFFCLFNSQGFLAKYRIRCFKSNKILHQKTRAERPSQNRIWCLYPFFKDLEEMRFLLILLRTTLKQDHKSLPRRKYCNIRKEIAPLSKLFSGISFRL